MRIPYGVADADRASILSFLDWLQDNALTREAPRYDLPMTRGQTLAWLTAMTGITQAPALREEWAAHGGKAWIWSAESGWYSRPWHLAPPGAWADPQTRGSLCCDFFINRCPLGVLCPREHGPSHYGEPSFLELLLYRYDSLYNHPGGPHGVLLALNSFSCSGFLGARL